MLWDCGIPWVPLLIFFVNIYSFCPFQISLFFFLFFFIYIISHWNFKTTEKSDLSTEDMKKCFVQQNQSSKCIYSRMPIGFKYVSLLFITYECFNKKKNKKKTHTQNKQTKHPTWIRISKQCRKESRRNIWTAILSKHIHNAILLELECTEVMSKWIYKDQIEIKYSSS